MHPAVFYLYQESAIGSPAALQSLEHVITLDKTRLYRPEFMAVKGSLEVAWPRYDQRACVLMTLSVFAIRVKQCSFYS